MPSTDQLANLVAGYDQGVFSGIVGNPNFLDQMKHPNDSLTGIIVSIYNLGCFFRLHRQLLDGRLVGPSTSHVVCYGLDPCWRHVAVLSIQRATSDGWSIHYWNRHWHRDIDCAYVSGGAGRCKATWKTGLQRTATGRRGNRHCVKLLAQVYDRDLTFCRYFFDYGMSFVGGPISWRLPIACQMIFAFVSQLFNGAGRISLSHSGRHLPSLRPPRVPTLLLPQRTQRRSPTNSLRRLRSST